MVPFGQIVVFETVKDASGPNPTEINPAADGCGCTEQGF